MNGEGETIGQFVGIFLLTNIEIQFFSLFCSKFLLNRVIVLTNYLFRTPRFIMKGGK
jgi:hypothetical protein